MAERRIAIKITLENADASRNAKAMKQDLDDLGQATEKHTHLQEGLTNSFIKGNLYARAISVGYNLVKDSTKYLITETAQLEFTLAKVAAATGANDVVIQKLQDSIFTLGRTTASSVGDISKAALELAKLGFSGKELEIVLGGVSRLSSALGDSLEATGQLVGGVVNTFDLSSEQAATVADKLFVATGKSAASIESFKVAFGLAGNVAANSGVSFEELSAAIATLSNQGVRASTIGTGLRTFLTNIAVEGSKAQQVLGDSFKSGGLIGAMQKLAELHPDTGSIFEMFGKPGSPVAAALMKSTEMYKQFLDAVEKGQGTLQDGGDKIKNTLVGSVIILKNSMLEFFAISSSPAANQFKLFIENLTDRIQYTTDHLKKRKGFDDFVRDTQSKGKNPFTELGVTPDPNKPFEAEGQLRAAYEKKKLLDDAKASRLLLEQEKLKKSLLPPPDTSAGNKLDFGDKKKKEKYDSQKPIIPLMEKLKPTEVAEEFGAPKLEEIKRLFREVGEEVQYLAKADDDAMKSMVKHAEDYKKIQNELEATRMELAKNTLEFSYLQVGIEGVNGSIDILSGYLANGLISKGDDPFKHISDAFGDMAKKMVSDLIALTMRLLIFRSVLALLGGGGFSLAGGFNFLSTGSGLKDAGLGLLGGSLEKRASGNDSIVRQPTMFMAGDGGPERVQITPRAKLGSGGSSGGPTFIIQGDVYDYDKFQRKVKQASESNRRDYV